MTIGDGSSVTLCGPASGSTITDQRGVPDPATSAGCDRGSVQLVPTTVAVSSPDTGTLDVTVTSTLPADTTSPPLRGPVGTATISYGSKTVCSSVPITDGVGSCAPSGSAASDYPLSVTYLATNGYTASSSTEQAALSVVATFDTTSSGNPVALSTTGGSDSGAVTYDLDHTAPDDSAAGCSISATTLSAPHQVTATCMRRWPVARSTCR